MKQNKLQRSREGEKAGIFGLGCNLILAAAKLFIGITGNYIIVIADGANNLMDSISALITILGFRMGSAGKDEMHPYGHGRIEYIAGFLISLLILGTGISIGKEAVTRIFYPEMGSASMLAVLKSGMQKGCPWQAFGIFLCSILIKVGMTIYYQIKNRDMQSPVLDAMRKDSFGDACASALTLAGLVMMPYSDLPLDGILGMVMAVYIFISGAKSFQENMALLLGQGASRKTEDELRAILSECLEIESVEGITIHDYGPEKKVAAAEVSFAKDCDQEMLHRAVNHVVQLCKDTMNIELSLYQSLYCYCSRGCAPRRTASGR